MKIGHGVFFQYDNGRTICVAAAKDHATAQSLFHKLTFYLKARDSFGGGHLVSKDEDERDLFEHFEKLERRLGSERILRSGTGEILLAIKEV